MGFLDFFAQIVWIAAGLAVFLAVALYFLPDLYNDWQDAKHQIKYDVQIYQLVHTAMEELEKTGKPVTLVFGHKEDDDGTTKEDEECNQREQPEAD